MRKYYTLLMFFMCLCMSAQTLKGDMDDDGELTITDVTMLINAYLNYEKPTHQNRNGHECVDLGLPSGILWATCNVGATSPEEYGDYFAWGETKPKAEYSWSNYKWCNGSKDSIIKYCISSSYGTVDNKTALDPEDDAARVNWGGDWRMPTDEELDELHRECSWTWTNINGKRGYKVISTTNGNSIFLPAAGLRCDNLIFNTNSSGSYWSLSLETDDPDDPGDAFVLGFNSNYVESGSYRYYGLSVRPVCHGNGSDKVVAVTSITLSANTLTLTPNGSQTLTTTVLPANASNANIVWSSSNESVATVNNGTVVAKGKGIAVIIATAADGSGVKAECAVTVINTNGHEYVDLGLPSGTLWATCNVGASSPEKNGDLFAWGETTPKSEYDWMAYKWCSNSENTMTKYCVNFLYGTVDKKTVLDLEDDAAHVNWGGDWRMPTADELNELHSKCTCTWTETKGVYGCMFEGPNGNSIFLPAAGYRRDDSLSGDGSDGYYWSSSLHPDYSSFASYLGLGFGYVNLYGNYRNYGHSVRPVCK